MRWPYVAGAVFMMLYMAVTGQSVWTNPNLIAVMWLGSTAANGSLGWHTALGFATHMITSGLMGIVGLAFISSLPNRRTMLAAFGHALC